MTHWLVRNGILSRSVRTWGPRRRRAKFPPESGTTTAWKALQPRSECALQDEGGWSTQMATDYDSPRKTDDDLTEDSLQELQARRMDKSSSTIDLDPDDVAESLELPGADLSNEELSFRVIPRQADEFSVPGASLCTTGASLQKTATVSLSAGNARLSPVRRWRARSPGRCTFYVPQPGSR